MQVPVGQTVRMTNGDSVWDARGVFRGRARLAWCGAGCGYGQLPLAWAARMCEAVTSTTVV